MNFHFPIAQLIAGNHVRGQTAPGSELPTSFYGKLFFESNGGALLTTLYQFRPPGGPLMFAAANRIRDFELPTGLPAVQVPGGWAGALQGFGTGRHLALLQFGQPAMGPDPMNPTSFDGSLALGSPPRVFPIRGTVDHLGRFHAVGGNRDALLQMSGRAFAPQIGGNAFRMEGSFQLNSYNIQLPSDAGSVLFLR
jgi:hypothetical protein